MRVLMWFSAGFALACALGAYCYGTYLPVLAAFSLISGILLFFLRPRRWLRMAALAALGVCVGICWFLLFDRVTLSEARRMDGQTQPLSFIAQDYSTQTAYGCGFTAAVTLGSREYTARVYLRDDVQVQPGDRITGEFRIKMLVHPGQKPDYLSGNGIYLTASQYTEAVDIAPGKASLSHYPQIIRHRLLEILDACIPADAAGFAKALLLGDTGGIDYETDTAFQISGISHVIAVSGMHVSILFSLLYVISGRHRLVTAALGIPVIFMFAAVAGFTPSIVRAAIMQCLFILALLLERDYDPLTALGFAALVMLGENPMVITSVSFQLSFACMLGIFLFYIPLYQFFLGKADHCKLRAAAAASIAVTLSASVFTTPLVAVYFGCVSLIGVVTNLLTLGLISFVFYGLLALCALYFVSAGLALFLGSLLAVPIRFILACIRLLSKLPLAAVYTESVYITAWLVFCYLLLFIHLLRKRKRTVLHIAAAVLGLCLSLGLSWLEPLLYDCHVTVLDVGQGQCVILQSEGKTFVVDCGGSYAPAAADKAAQTLSSYGIRQIDGLILTHYDGDHVGGAAYLLQQVSAKAMYLPYTEDADGIGPLLEQTAGSGASYVSRDTVLEFGSSKLTIFAPVTYESGNESSMCILFQTKNCDILVTGDRGEQTEKILLQRRDLPELEVLVVGHHGAKTSTSRALLEKTRPEYAVISVGEDNAYGHPSGQTLERLREFGCKILRTDRYGTVRFRR